MSASPSIKLIVGVGDIHGRFHRVQGWLADLEQARGREIDRVFAVGDVEAFLRADDHRRKAAKRTMPAEFAEYAGGARTMHRPLSFVGGNNEDFAELHKMPGGGDVAPGVEYLGRVGVRKREGLQVGYLSGIYAPRYFDQPLIEPKSADTYKQAGYFRRAEVEQLMGEHEVDLLLVHEWPKGLIQRGKHARTLRAHRTPWIGNPHTRTLVERITPSWVWCGHSHVPYAATLIGHHGAVTRVACLDQAARPEGSIFWMEWRGGEPLRGGWGTTGKIHWHAGDPWTEANVPEDSAPTAFPSEKIAHGG